MYAKSFMVFDGNGRLIGARTAQTVPYDRYRCHLCGSALHYHPEYDTERPWFEHVPATLTENGRQHCPYVKSEQKEAKGIRTLRRFIPDAQSVIRRTDWHCAGCNNDYHGECYCLSCRTGEYSHESTPLDTRLPEVALCAC